MKSRPDPYVEMQRLVAVANASGFLVSDLNRTAKESKRGLGPFPEEKDYSKEVEVGHVPSQ